jgi:hypothetical protein
MSEKRKTHEENAVDPFHRKEKTIQTKKNRVVDSSFAPENIETMLCGYIYPLLVEHHTLL